MANNTSDDELIAVLDKHAQWYIRRTMEFAKSSETEPSYVTAFNEQDKESLANLRRLIVQHEEQAAREIKTLNTHLSFMAGQYEGITGEKSAYLLKNWPEYKHLTTTHKGDQ